MLHNPHKNKYYSEEGQTLVVQFAFCKPVGNDFSTIHNFVNCRDFLSDVVWWKANQQYSQVVYRFAVQADDIADLQPLLAVTSDLMPILRTNLSLIRGIVNVHEIDETTVVLELAPYWIANPVNTSLLSLSLKLLALKENSTWEELIAAVGDHKERTYIKAIDEKRFLQLIQDPEALPTEPLIMANHDVCLQWPAYQIHEYLGIVSMFKKHSPASNLKDYFQQKQKQTESNAARQPAKNKDRNSRTVCNTAADLSA